MPILSNIPQDAAELYQGYDQQEVGMGLIDPNAYASPEYQKKKIQKIMIGQLSRIVYAGMEHDRQPLIVPIFFESQYNTILSYNLNYVPLQYRKDMLKFILDSNAARIKSNQPIMVDYHAVKRAVPISQYVVRRYKIIGVRVNETYPLIAWPEEIKGRSGWENHWRQFAREKTRR